MSFSEIDIAQRLRGPGRRRMLGDRDVDDPSTVVREDHEYEEQPEGVSMNCAHTAIRADGYCAGTSHCNHSESGTQNATDCGNSWPHAGSGAGKGVGDTRAMPAAA